MLDTVKEKKDLLNSFMEREVEQEEDSCPEMLVYDTRTKQSELKQYRISSGIKPRDIATEIGESYHSYMMKENGKRLAKNREDNEKFIYKVFQAIAKLSKERDENSDDMISNLMEDEDQANSLIYVPLDPQTYQTIKKRLTVGANLIAVCCDYGVDYLEVEKFLVADGRPDLTISNRDVVRSRPHYSLNDLVQDVADSNHKFTLAKSMNFMA